MTDASLWPWAALLLLGAAHGINPGMGWLFAVALGLQEQRRRAVWLALVPLALGHALAIGAVVVLATALGVVLPSRLLRWLVAAALLGLGIFHLIRHRHFRWGGMRVGARDLTIWSFLMASAHGAGLMALPLVLGATSHAHHGAVLHAGLSPAPSVGLLASGVHAFGYLAVTAVIAIVVYEKVGLRLLRTAWINVDLAWAGTLVVSAVLTPLL
ncbi:MAG: hypothetical protein ACREM9_01980 [Gemmatimonadales bacterium]